MRNLGQRQAEAFTSGGILLPSAQDLLNFSDISQLSPSEKLLAEYAGRPHEDLVTALLDTNKPADFRAELAWQLSNDNLTQSLVDVLMKHVIKSTEWEQTENAYKKAYSLAEQYTGNLCAYALQTSVLNNRMLRIKAREWITSANSKSADDFRERATLMLMRIDSSDPLIKHLAALVFEHDQGNFRSCVLDLMAGKDCESAICSTAIILSGHKSSKDYSRKGDYLVADLRRLAQDVAEQTSEKRSLSGENVGGSNSSAELERIASKLEDIHFYSLQVKALMYIGTYYLGHDLSTPKPDHYLFLDMVLSHMKEHYRVANKLYLPNERLDLYTKILKSLLELTDKPKYRLGQEQQARSEIRRLVLDELMQVELERSKSDSI